MQSGQDIIALLMPPGDIDPHGTLRFGTETYRAAFEEIGYRTRVFELSGLDRAMIEALRSPRIKAVFSDGGWIHRAFGGSANAPQPLCDLIGKPLVILISDSPCSYWLGPILGRDRENQTTVFIDADFAVQWSRWAAKAGTHQVYIPACPDLGPDMPDAERSIDRLAVVALRRPEFYRDLVRDRLKDDALLRVFDAIVDACLFDTLSPFSAVCDDVCRSLDAHLNYKSATVRSFLFSVDQFIRNRRREIMLNRLCSHPITLVGSAEGVRVHPDTRIMPPMPHARLVELYRRARCVIFSPPYSGGITERMVHPMAAGALVVAPPTSLSDRLLGRDRLFITARTDFSDMDACLERALDPVQRRRIAGDALVYARQRLSPAATVRRFLGEPDAPPLDAALPA